MTEEKQENGIPGMNEMGGQPCPMCSQNTLTLREFPREIPYFGEVYIFSMNCTNCHYHKSDVEPSEVHDPARYTLEISSEEDMNIRIVKSSSASVKLPRIATQEPGPASNGYVTNVEGILNRIKNQWKS